MLSGAALGLVLLFLLDENANAAQAPGQGPGANQGGGWGDAGPNWANRNPGEFRQGETNRARRSGDADQQNATPNVADPNLISHGYSHGAIHLQNLINTSDPKIQGLDVDEALPRPTPTAEWVEGSHAGNGQLDPGGQALNKDPVPTLVIRVSNQEEISSRTLEGLAIMNRAGAQVGLANGLLDLTQSTIPNLLIESDQGFHGLALSVENDTELSHHSNNAALLNALVIRGPETGTIWIKANQALTLAAHSPGRLQVLINEKLVAMEGSQLVDLGGDDSVNLGTNQQLNFSDGGMAQQEDLTIAVETYGMANSAMTMGAGDNWIHINSTLDPWQLGIGGLIGLLARNQDWGLRLQARAIAMDNSQLDSGDGNDQVWITAALDPSIGSQLLAVGSDPRAQMELQQIAARASSLNLGAGDDQVRLSGDVLDSSIDLGTGTNRLIFDNGAQNTAILMGYNSINQINMADQANSIDLHGGERLTLMGGTAEDQIVLTKEATTGLIDGAGGADTIMTTGNPKGGGSELAIDGPNRGKLDGLSILNIESIQLGDGDDAVMVSPEGWLTGQLSGGAGMDTLDFSANKTPVTGMLAPGSIRELGKISMGAISDFERVVGGSGDDQFFFGSPSTHVAGASSLEIRGGPGIDQFLWDSLNPSWPHGLDQNSGLPNLSDLQISSKADGGIGLSDQIGWATVNQGDPNIAMGSVHLLTPSTIEGLGDSQLLPIAPIDQLLAGQASLGTHAINQLAIGTTSTGAELLALGSQGENGVIAHLPGFFNGYSGSIP